MSASVVTMSTAVLAKVSTAERKLKRKLLDQRVKEEQKLQDLRVKESTKVVNKIASARLGLDIFIAKEDCSTLPEMVQTQLRSLAARLQHINDESITIAEGNGGEIVGMQDTTHT